MKGKNFLCLPFNLTKPNHVSPLYKVLTYFNEKERAVIHIRC